METKELQGKFSRLSESEFEKILRAKRPEKIIDPALIPSAVTVPLIRRAQGWCALFTKRSQRVETHKGEVSFPGGTIEEGETALGASLRELEEEVGIPREKVRVLGELDEISTISGFRIQPFVICLNWPAQIITNPGEIDEVYILPLSQFLDPARLRIENWQWNGREYPVYFFQLPECTVWGATAKITKNFLERLQGSIIS